MYGPIQSFVGCYLGWIGSTQSSHTPRTSGSRGSLRCHAVLCKQTGRHSIQEGGVH